MLDAEILKPERVSAFEDPSRSVFMSDCVAFTVPILNE